MSVAPDTAPTDPVALYSSQQQAALDKLVALGKMTKPEATVCNRLFTRFYQQKLSEGVELNWADVQPMPKDNVLDIEELTKQHFTPERISEFLEKLVVLKLNGGVGTSMGCSYPKSCIEVKDNLTFLHMTLKQIDFINKRYGTHVPLVLMNSERTDEMTREVIERAKKDLKVDVDVYFFNQPVFPRADEETLLPTTAVSVDNQEFWYPPGHASVLTSFKESGLAEKFSRIGKEWVFISNADNLGATPDGDILGNIITFRDSNAAKGSEEQKYSFFMETTPKTLLDVKGGTPILYKGSTFLLEASQIPKGRENDVYDIKRFTLFNTANIWINLQDWIAGESFDLPIIFNPKTIQGDKGPARVVQLEMGVGAALSHFKSKILSVPRRRFIPVKLTCDLLRLQSDLFTFHEDGVVEPTTSDAPVIVLSKDFSSVEDYKRRVSGSVSLIRAKRVVLDGDIRLQGPVAFEGEVEIHRAGEDGPCFLTGSVRGSNK